ncbi:hypothetical protein J1614_006783 [Plenodomus biglobosus]|nr:hypothetical protein J1614_006783 [Plenodomus biglobosus]
MHPGLRSLSARNNIKSTTRSTNRMASAPFAHLYSATSLTASLRTFSTSSRLASSVGQEQDSAVAAGEGGIIIPDNIFPNDFLETLNLGDTLGFAVAEAMKHVRNTHKLSDPKYDDYWRLVVKAQLADENDKDKANANAARTLVEINAKSSTPSTAGRKPVTKHNKLMDHIQKHADIISKTTETQRMTSSRKDALKGLLSDMDTPQSNLRLIEHLESKIRDLKSRIATEKAKYAPDPTTTHEYVSSTRPKTEMQKAERQALRLRSRLDAREQLIKEHLSDIELPTVLENLLDIVARDFYAAEFQFSKHGPSNSVEDMQLWQRLRKELIDHIRHSLNRPKFKWEATQVRKRINECMEMGMTNAKTVTPSSDEKAADAPESPRVERPNMPDAVKDELLQMKSTIKEYYERLAVLRNTASQQAQMMHDVRKKKQDLHARRRDLFKQLEEQDHTVQQAQFELRPKRLEKLPKSQIRTDLDDILDDALTATSGGRATDDDFRPVREGSVHPLGLQAAEEMDSITKTNDAGTSRDTPSMVPEPATTVADTAPLTEATSQSVPKLMSKSSPSALPTPELPHSQKVIPPKPERRPGDALRLKVPASNTIPIDATLTVDLSAPIPSLQTQVYQMQQRLRSSYPRIDNLPYEVWTSENKRTLQTWLKILVSRWQTRFDDVGAGVKGDGEINAVDEQVKAVLDQMVRDHDLSNEAAERMAMHWHEVVTNRWGMDGDAEGVLDWDEFNAGGFGFMAAEEGIGEFGEETGIEEGGDAVKIAGTADINRTMVGFGSIARRLYSTSTRPPREPIPTATSSSTEMEPATHAKASSSSSQTPTYGTHLPHLTPTGTAHMVSVSSKPATHRTAIAVGTVHFSNPTPLSLIRSASLKKGDVLSVSRIAGIMAAKKCPDIVPLCHPIALSHVGVEVSVFEASSSGVGGADNGIGNHSGIGGEVVTQSHETQQTQQKQHRHEHQQAPSPFGGIHIQARVECTGPTGVEMEALTAVMGAALSVLDMCKAVDKAQVISGVRVVRKEGGRSGSWAEEGWGGGGGGGGG